MFVECLNTLETPDRALQFAPRALVCYNRHRNHGPRHRYGTQDKDQDGGGILARGVPTQDPPVVKLGLEGAQTAQ
jgi:hypothetical protein